MKLVNVNNVERFFDLVKESKGSVNVVARNGMEINLKENVALYKDLVHSFADGKSIPEIELNLSEREDVVKFMRFMVNNGHLVA